MSFWKKFKKGMKIGAGMAKDALPLMGLLPGPIGTAAMAAAPVANAMSNILDKV